MNISQAAAQSGLSAKMIRHYEGLGLIPAAVRSEAGYRHYRDTDLDTLRFIKQARALGFSLDQVADLLALWRDRERSSADVKRLALAHIADLDAKIEQLTAMSRALKHLANHCHGDDRPDCPIMDGLARNARDLAGCVSP